jgi:lysine biosynthesis protein LysW
MAKAFCPNCDAEIQMRNPKLGAKLTCPECEEQLEVVSTNPFDVDYPYEDDWDDDWDEDWTEEDWND